MNAESRVAQHFADSIAAKQAAADALPAIIANAGLLMGQSLQNDGKILSCGNGGSAGGVVESLRTRKTGPASGRSHNGLLDAHLNCKRLRLRRNFFETDSCTGAKR
jgi:hypothetical protein